MSATSVKIQSRESIYQRLLKDLFTEGTNYVLLRNFALGKEWDIDKINFLYQYLTLLCNFSCDVEHYFNEKLKNLLHIKSECKISLKDEKYLCEKIKKEFNIQCECNSLQEINMDLYNLWISQGNTGTQEEFLNLLLKDNDSKVFWDEIQE